jgi:RNA binding exosome subunit
MFYQAKVKVKQEDDKGKIKKATEVFLVDAESVTEVEVIVTKGYFGVNFDWELMSVSETKILKVLTGSDRADQ